MNNNSNKIGFENFFKNMASEIAEGLYKKEEEYKDLDFQIRKCRKKLGETDQFRLINGRFYYKDLLVNDITAINDEKTCFYSRTYKLIKFNKNSRLYEQYCHD